MDLVSIAYAPGTVRNYRCQWVIFLNFAIQNCLQIFPPSVHTVVLFYTSLTTKLKSYSAFLNYQSAIKLLYQIYGYNLDTGLVQLKFLNRGAKKVLSTVPATKAPLEPKHLVAFIQIMDSDNPFHLCFVAAVSIGFFALLRRSNICPPSTKQFDPSKHLRRSDITMDVDGVNVALNWTKTNQSHDTVFQVPIAHSHNPLLDPPQLYKTFVNRFPVLPSHPAFSFYHQNAHFVLTHRDLSVMLSQFMSAAGFSTDGVTTHSIRKGGVCLLNKAGISIPALKHHGTWTSEAYKSYLHFDRFDKLSVTKKAYQHLNLSL